MKKRIIRFDPAFDKRHSDPKKDYGIHGVTLGFYLKGNEGTVQFVIYTNWQMPHVQKEFDAKMPDHKFPYMFHEPMAADLGYHSPHPMYKGQTKTSVKCEWLNDTCYYDGSGVNAKRVFDILRERGDGGVWEELEKTYRHYFEKKGEQ